MTAVGKTVEPQYVGEYAYRSLIDMSVAEGILGVELAGNTNVWESYDGYVIHYPVEKGRMINVVAVLQDKASTEEHSYERLVKPVPRKSMYKDFQHWDPRLQLLLREFKSSDQWSLWDLIHREPYNYGRVCLLGDAAHAAVPHLGSGAGMAVEDAYILGSLIDGWGRTHLEVALSAYDQVRRSRTQKLARLSREAGQKYTFTLPGVLDNPEALQAYAKDQFRWIWNFDLEHQLYEAWDTAAGMVNRSP
jgi:salicylate hydroxylase